MRRIRGMVLTIGIVLMSVTGGMVAAQESVQIVPPGEEFGGATAAEWEARWWQWALSLPEAVNPNFDLTGANCGAGQFGPVFLLPSSFLPPDEDIEFRCVVPEGLGIYVSLGGAGCTTVEPPPFFGRDEAEMAACAEEAADMMISSEVTINGEPVENIEQYRMTTPVFTMNFGPDNIYGLEPVVADSVVSSYGFIIEPPAPGEYEIVIVNEWEGLDEPVRLAHTIVVTPATVIEPEASPVASPVA